VMSYKMINKPAVGSLVESILIF